MIKSKLEIIDKDTVIQHRRWASMFFYVNLKPITWKRSQYESHYMVIGLATVLLPDNKTTIVSYWKNKDMRASYKLSNQLDELTKHNREIKRKTAVERYINNGIDTQELLAQLIDLEITRKDRAYDCKDFSIK